MTNIELPCLKYIIRFPWRPAFSWVAPRDDPVWQGQQEDPFLGWVTLVRGLRIGLAKLPWKYCNPKLFHSTFLPSFTPSENRETLCLTFRVNHMEGHTKREESVAKIEMAARYVLASEPKRIPWAAALAPGAQKTQMFPVSLRVYFSYSFQV